ncbi:ribonuclease T2-like protein [Mycena belliarum]|uniref:ribonuclease T2 n=1 Tax=Mycena belliarum TaxID=1033014 RepID=A0AAD6U7M7_9AGAR|nr:ribonuclease T2-like protein [Mycena belliae]
MPSLLVSALVGLVGARLASSTVQALRTAHNQSPFSNSANLPATSSCGGGVASCTNTTVVSDLCCFEAPGGLLLQTQFWDTKPSTGPANSWTIHGLWPDHCDLGFSENCDPSRAYTNIGGLLSDQGAQDTLDYMQTYWVDIDGHDETFWEHEWKTHGTCMSTLKLRCLPEGSPKGAEVNGSSIPAHFKLLRTSFRPSRFSTP